MKKVCFKNTNVLRTINIILIILAIITLILFFYPIYYLQSGEHVGQYYNAFHCLDNENLWILIVSIILLALTIYTSIFNLFSRKNNKNFIIITFVIYAITVVFCITTFILGANTTNLPK